MADFLTHGVKGPWVIWQPLPSCCRTQPCLRGRMSQPRSEEGIPPSLSGRNWTPGSCWAPWVWHEKKNTTQRQKEVKQYKKLKLIRLDSHQNTHAHTHTTIGKVLGVLTLEWGHRCIHMDGWTPSRSPTGEDSQGDSHWWLRHPQKHIHTVVILAYISRDASGKKRRWLTCFLNYESGF